jgi:hypothetical protein
MGMQRMKLYCWNDPIKVHHGGSFLVVAARTEASARRIAKDAVMLEYGGGLKDEKLGREAVERLGKPDHIYECPHGLVYWYHE